MSSKNACGCCSYVALIVLKRRQATTGIFLRLPIIAKRALKKMKTVFSRKNTPSSSYLLNFSTSKSSWFVAKYPHNQGEKHTFKTIDHLIRILQQICRIWRFWNQNSSFLEKPIYFLKITANFEVFEKIYFFSRILRQICYKLVKKYHVEKLERTLWTQLTNIG